MENRKWDRMGAASGYLVFVLGIAAAAFERGAPPASAPIDETMAFLDAYRSELLIQSLLFVMSAAVYLWFFSSLRSFLFRAEGQPGTISTSVFGAGVLWATLQMVFQGGQVALASSDPVSLEPGLVAMMTDLTYAISVIAYIPMAVMLLSVAVISHQTNVLPRWHTWLSSAAALVNLLLSMGIVVPYGLLAPGAALTYVVYLLTVVWLLATSTLLFRAVSRGQKSP